LRKLRHAVQTQLTIAVKIVMVIVLVVALSAMLMTFAKIRTVGMSILASAGINGITVCEVREKLLAFVQEKYQESLPRARADLRTIRG
jgi:hypothetical protein